MKILKNIKFMAGFLILALCAISLVASIQGMAISGIAQTVQPFSDNHIIAQANPLFMLDGTSNVELINQLYYLSENAGRGAPNLHVDHIGVSGIEVSDARHIREFNGGELPDIFLFEPHGTFSNAGMPSHGMVNDQSRDNFTHSRWRLVYITHPDNGDDPVFTFKMVDAFRSNRMHSTGLNWLNGIRYENSDLRLNLIEEFNNVLDLFPNSSDLRTNFVAPIDVPGGWQKAQPDLGQVVHQLLEAGADNDGAIHDLIWLPSAYEVAGSSAGNQDLWRLTREERAHVQNGFGQWAWLRSGHDSGEHDNRARMIEGFGTQLRNDSEAVTTSRGIAPAIHLSLSNYAFIDADFSSTSSRDTTVQVGQEPPTSQTRFSIEKANGENTIVFDAGQLNIVQNLTIRYGTRTITITPTDTPIEYEESLGTFSAWYTNGGRVVHLHISDVNQSFRVTAQTTNNWEITRIYGWPAGFGISASPPNSTVIAENSFLNVIEALAVTPNGHHFYGWWTNNGTSGNWGDLVDINTAVANVGNLETVEHIAILYARWMPNTAIVERVHYDDSVENLGIHVVWFAGAVMEPVLSNHLPADENLVFGGWWSQDGTGGEWGMRVTANTFITKAQNGTTTQIFARWQLYVPRPSLNKIDLLTQSISWESNISGASFVISVNGEAYKGQAEDHFSFAHFTQGTHTISIRTVSAGYESDALFVTIVIPHTPTFAEVWTGYDDNEPRPDIGDTRMYDGYEYELVRWDSLLSTAENGDMTLTHTAVWVRIEAPVHTPTFTEVWTGYDDNEPRPDKGDTRMYDGYEYELVRWDSLLSTAENGDMTLTHTAVWVRIEAILSTEVVTIHFVDSRSIGGFGIDTRTVVDIEKDIASPNWTREGYILSWEATVEDGIMTFTAVWTPQNQGDYELGNFTMNAISWILLGFSISLTVAFVLVIIFSEKRRRKIGG